MKKLLFLFAIGVLMILPATNASAIPTLTYDGGYTLSDLIGGTFAETLSFAGDQDIPPTDGGDIFRVYWWRFRPAIEIWFLE